MKRKFVLVLLLSLTCLTGCVEYKATMDIKNDKSMNFAIDYALDTTIFGDEDAISSTELDKLKEDGYTIENYEHDNMKGYTISKSIKNIDAISSKEDIEYNLSGILNEEDANVNVFKVKKGFFKNIYYANFTFDASDSGLSDNEGEEPTEDDELGDITSSIMSNLDLSFNVKLPSKAIKHNAENENNDGRELSWSLSSNSVDNITFSFSIINTGNIILGVLIIAILLGAYIYLHKKKTTK